MLAHDALRPWRYRSWISPRDPHFLERACPVLDLYACQWQGQALWADEYVLSSDEKTSIQVRRRLHPTLPIGPHQATRVEHEYERAGVLQYPAAWDVHRAVLFGRCEPKTGKAAFGRLVDDVMDQEPYRSSGTSTVRVPRRLLATTGLRVCDASDAIVRDARTPDYKRGRGVGRRLPIPCMLVMSSGMIRMGDQVRDRPSVPGSERPSGSEAVTYSPVRARTVAGAMEPAFARSGRNGAIRVRVEERCGVRSCLSGLT